MHLQKAHDGVGVLYICEVESTNIVELAVGVTEKIKYYNKG